jgi:dipeptidyl aminopeptidase/acylaminoacyl peptidase
MTEGAWQRRFTATELGLPCWSADAPERVAFVSTEGGVRQVWALDRSTGERRRISNEGPGVEQVLASPDGRIVWWSDADGNERGHWVAVPFEGGVPSPLLPDVPDNWSAGVSLVGSSVAIGQATDDDYRVYVAQDGGSARLLYQHEQPAGLGRLWPEGTGGLSADASLLCVRHTEHGDILHSALRVLDTQGGGAIGELEDPGRSLDPVAWSPSSPTLLFTSERGAFERPAIWDLSTGDRWDLEVDLPGAVIPLTWYPDGGAILVRQEHEAIDRLHRVDVRSGVSHLVAQPGGEIEDAVVRPDGEVWLVVSDTSHPRRPETADGKVVVESPEDPPPHGRPYRFFWFENPSGERIQAFVVTPFGVGPFPMVMHPHGGPEWHHRDSWEPEIQALVDAGYAVAGVNYRGSTGYGIAFRERLIGDPFFPESEDVLACLDTLIADGVADEDEAFLAGWSWGGCLACLNEGLHPDRWRAVFAGVPAGDLVAAHWAAMPTIRALDVALFGGDPDEARELYRERDPMTYVGKAKAPVLVIAGEQDPRCPLEGVTPWVEALRERGVEVELSLYPTGHNVNDTEQQIRHAELILDFFGRHRRNGNRKPPTTDG